MSRFRQQTRDSGSEFQTDNVANRKERFAQSEGANGWISSGVADKLSVRALTRPVSVPDRSIIGGLYGGWLVHENRTTGSPPERVYRKPDRDPGARFSKNVMTNLRS